MSVLIGKEFFNLPWENFEEPKSEKINILIIEDLAADAELIEHELRKGEIKFNSIRIETFDEFIKQINQFNPDIILADYSLPSFSGMEAIKYLKDHNKDIPIILVTGSQSEEVAVQSLKEGADDYILKSNLVRLSNAVSNSINKKKIEHAKLNAEMKLLHYKELYENLLQTQSQLDTGFLIFNGDSHQILYVNQTFCSLCGYDVEEVLNMQSVLKILSQESISNFLSQIKKLQKDESKTVSFVTSLVRKDQQIINLEFIGKKLIKNNDVQIVMIVRDVTEQIRNELMQRLTQEALRESEKRFRSIIEDVKDYAIIMLNSDGKIISWNKGAQRILGYNEDEIMLKDFDVFFPKSFENVDTSISIFKKASEDSRVEKELWLIKKGEQKFWAAITITAIIKDEESLQYFSIIIRDLSKSKIAEDQLREHELQLRALAEHLQNAREEERTRIARELHDEFSQMLTALRMDLTILSRMISKTVNEPLSRISLLEKISSISELLEITIRSTRRIITELRPAVLDELGLSTAIQWQAQEFENRTGIRCKIIRMQRDVVFDQNTSTAIFRILQEALTNVARHAKANNVIISLQLIEKNIILEISDNGKGMEAGTFKDPTSTGILGIRERVLALGGNVDILSEKDKGTKLILKIPYKEE